MHGTQQSSFIRNAATLTIISILTSGCLMGEEESKSDQNILAEHDLTGSVGDGPVVGATMRILRNDGVELAQVESDASANYNITVRTEGQYYPLSIDAINGTDIVTNAAPDFVLLGAVFEPGAASVANVNPFSTFAVELARDLPGGINMANLETAQSIVSSEFNNGLTSLASSGPMTTAVDGGNVAEIIRASEALGETVRRTRDALGANGFATSGDDVVRALSSDLTDTVVDGNGGPRVDARIAAVAVIVSAQVLLETMANELHVNGADATQLMNNAIDQVAVGTASPPLEDLTATSDMLARARIGIVAAHAITNDNAIADLLTDVEGVQTGTGSSTIRTFALPNDYRSRLDNAILLAAGGSGAVITTVNDISRDGTQTIDGENRAPTISGTPANSVDVDTAYSFTPTASDPDVGDTLTFSVSGEPSWASIDTDTGEFSGTPTAAGVHNGIVISVSDGALSASLPAFSITVNDVAVNSPPVISGTPPAEVNVDQNYSFTPTASDPDVGDTLTFSVSGEPSWASIDTDTGEFSGTPTAAGVHNGIVISVSDGALSASLPAFSITVNDVAVNSPPVISGTPPAEVNVDQNYSFTPTVSDPDDTTFTFTVSGLPSWASFNDTNGQIGGTPEAGDVGVYSGISITVSDGQAEDTLGPFTITVNDVVVNTPPVISGTPPADVNAGQPYSFTPTVTDPDSSTFSFTVSGLPSWADFNDMDGTISGTPQSGDVNTYSGISITVSDGQAEDTLGPFTITVQAISLGSVTLTWTAPTLNEDGTDLTDLDGYKIYWGTTPGVYPNSVTIDNETVTMYVIDNLSPGTYEFVATSFKTSGVESAYSNTATKVVP